MVNLRRSLRGTSVSARWALTLALAAMAGAPPSAATPLTQPEDLCSGQEHERLQELMRWLLMARPRQIGAIGSWTREGTAHTYFGRHSPEVTLEVAVFTTRTPAPGDGVEGHFDDEASVPLPRRGRSAFFDGLAIPPRLELHRLDSAMLRSPRFGEVSVRVHTRGCYGVLLLRR